MLVMRLRRIAKCACAQGHADIHAAKLERTGCYCSLKRDHDRSF